MIYNDILIYYVISDSLHFFSSRRLSAASLMAFYGLDLLAWQCPARLDDPDGPDGDDFHLTVSADEDSMFGVANVASVPDESFASLNLSLGFKCRNQSLPSLDRFAQVRRSRFETLRSAL